jgi:hypothetical protein
MFLIQNYLRIEPLLWTRHEKWSELVRRGGRKFTLHCVLKTSVTYLQYRENELGIGVKDVCETGVVFSNSVVRMPIATFPSRLHTPSAYLIISHNKNIMTVRLTHYVRNYHMMFDLKNV